MGELRIVECWLSFNYKRNLIAWIWGVELVLEARFGRVCENRLVDFRNSLDNSFLYFWLMQPKVPILPFSVSLSLYMLIIAFCFSFFFFGHNIITFLSPFVYCVCILWRNSKIKSIWNSVLTLSPRLSGKSSDLTI